jgi:seryl-tRNA synthetase
MKKEKKNERSKEASQAILSGEKRWQGYLTKLDHCRQKKNKKTATLGFLHSPT